MACDPKSKNKDSEFSDGEEKETVKMERSNPHFFKVFLRELCSKHLRIPPAFIDHLGTESLGLISLKGPSGNLWSVELVASPGGLHFQNGWKEFVGDHYLDNGDFLIFRLDGPCCFSVMVFDTTACEKQSCLLAKPCKKEYESVDAFGADIEIGKKVMKMSAGSHAILCSQDEHINIAGKKRKNKTGKCRANLPCQNTPESIDAGDQYTTPLSKKLVDFRNNNSECLRLIKSSELQRRGQFVAKVQKITCIKSGRRSVTDDEKENTLQRAKSFKSDKPFVVIVMRESYVYNGFFLHIPCYFSREHLPKVNQKMTLWDPTGKQWPVTYVTYDNRQSALSGGWAGFTIAHNLEKDDVCVFELVDQENIKVHMFRVVEEITPLRRNLKRSV